MKKLIPIILLAFFSIDTKSQSIPNPGFEDWTAGPGYDDPNGWGTINSLIASVLPGGTAIKTTTAGEIHSGSSAIRLVTKTISTFIVPGICATGVINTDGSISGGIAYDQRPVSMTGWYIYNPVNGDTGSVEVTLSKWNGTSRDVVGHTRIEFIQNTTSYQQFVDSIEYVSGATPDTAVIVLISCAGDHGIVGSTLFIDDLAFAFDNTGIQNHSTTLKVGIGPNPAQNTLHIINLKTDANLELFDVTGRKVGLFQVSENKQDVNIAHLTNGTYIYRVSDRREIQISTGKLIIKR